MPPETSNEPKPSGLPSVPRDTELAARQSGLAFQRTRMSADRTLMSMLRTSISLVSFGFTIAQFLHHLREGLRIQPLIPGRPGLALGLAMVVLGNLLLAVALAQHVSFMRNIRAERALLVERGMLHGEEPFAPSLVFYTALLFLMIALLVLLGLAFRTGPFS